jgi:hypothetical protein
LPNPPKTAKLKHGVSLTLDKSWGAGHNRYSMHVGKVVPIGRLPYTGRLHGYDKFAIFSFVYFF